jgi:hypothetical protein
MIYNNMHIDESYFTPEPKKSLADLIEENDKKIERRCKMEIKDELIYNKVFQSPSVKGINGLYPETSSLFKPKFPNLTIITIDPEIKRQWEKKAEIVDHGGIFYIYTF